MSVFQSVAIPQPGLRPRLPFYPEVGADIEITSVDNLYKDTSKTVSSVFVTCIGHKDDEILYTELPSEDSESTAPKVVLLVNPVHNPNAASEITRELVITIFSGLEPKFVNMKGCSDAEYNWVIKRIPEEESGGCTLY